MYFELLNNKNKHYIFYYLLNKHNLRFLLIPHKKAILWGPHDFAIATLGICILNLYIFLLFII